MTVIAEIHALVFQRNLMKLDETLKGELHDQV